MNCGQLKTYLIKQAQQRNIFTRKVVESTYPRKIIVSGPGTGKTYIFKELLKNKQGDCLALTFINNLADKLKKDLEGLAKSCTFHSFCKELLHKIECEGINSNFIFFPELELIIKSDAQIIYNRNLNFRRSFARLDYKTGDISFYIKRSNYYNAVSFDDCVFRVFEYLKENPNEIPEYQQIVVDEYQDFNKLEVELIDILETRSPILIVGDDDQALYVHLRYASPKYIREKFNDSRYMKFQLPFSNRCPKVIIDAMNDIVSQAKATGKLKNRVDKRFICYLPEKLSDNKKYPWITQVHCTVQSKGSPYIAKFIEEEIDKLSPEEIKDANSKGDYTVLITGPKRYLKQINFYLERGEKYCLHHRELESEPKKVKVIDGYKILLKDKLSNLGWRILTECERRTNQKIEDLLKEIVRDSKKRIYDYLPKDFIKKHEKNLKVLEKFREGNEITEDQRKSLESFFKTKIENLKMELGEGRKVKKPARTEIFSPERVSVMLTTYVGCKGISAGYVFIIGLNEGNLPKSNRNPSDIEISQFIVVLTRTIKKCYLISTSRFAGQSEGSRSVFIDWIRKDRVKYKKVDAKYWKKSNLSTQS